MLRARRAIGWGLLAILVVSPVLSFVPLNLAFVRPAELRIGLTVFCTMPTTLSSGVALVAQGEPSPRLELLPRAAVSRVAGVTAPGRANAWGGGGCRRGQGMEACVVDARPSGSASGSAMREAAVEV